MNDHHHGPTLQQDLAQLARLAQRDRAARDPSPVAARRQALRWLSAGALGGVAPLALVGCGGGGDDGADAEDADASSGTGTGSDSDSSSGSGSTVSSGSGSDSGTVSSCSTTPGETNGPYPADGTLASGQRLNALALAGIQRSDIRTSVGSASGTAAGVPMTLRLKLVNTNASCANLAGCAVYVWHCTRDGNYSMYSSSVSGENFLRGVLVADANGEVSFTTVFPGCYAGRWPHIHFEVYASLNAALDSTTVGDSMLVSQVALPAAACNQVYGVASGYSASVANLAALTLASDNVFGNDSAARQMATVTGNVTDGFAATLTVGLAA